MGEFASSHIIIVEGSAHLCDPVRQWLAPLGWTCECRTAVNDFGVGNGDCPALICVDATIDAGRRETWLASLRSIAGIIGGTPVVLVAAKDAPMQKGMSDRIDLPLDRENMLAVIERWAGPVDNHGFRDILSPHYRLVRLAGRESADRLLRSFARHIETALVELDGKEPVTRIAHQIAGLAGTMGYAELSLLWSAVERGEADGPGAARAATLGVLRELKAMLADD